MSLNPNYIRLTDELILPVANIEFIAETNKFVIQNGKNHNGGLYIIYTKCTILNDDRIMIKREDNLMGYNNIRRHLYGEEVTDLLD